ncbi:MAG: hypothetical protein ACFE9Q_08405 [Candidatus Hodarchaeota archaeon]
MVSLCILSCPPVITPNAEHPPPTAPQAPCHPFLDLYPPKPPANGIVVL